jgi:3-phenylpropionate/trans-cinnamate dioxygenase ferredoxin reductase subunit
MEHVVVVGASLAGLRAAETLRSLGFAGTLTVVGSEAHLPYDRPPLSKKFLAGEWEADRIALRRPESLGELQLTLRLGVAAVALDTTARRIELADSTHLGYDGLIIATGAATRTLPGQPDWAGIHAVRSLDDALALRQDLSTPRAEATRVVVIGAGFIGLEVAATAREAYGATVTVLEGLPAPLIRGLGATMGAAVAAVHADHDVEIRCGVRVDGLVGDGGRVTGVALAGGEVVAADIVVVGIGVAPATAWLESSGLTLADGVVCDDTLCAGPSGVYAAGDIARWPNAWNGETMRVEHWTTAAEQGAAAAGNLWATSQGQAATPYAALPFFWSDQFDARVQFLGRAGADDDVEVVAGSLEQRRFVALYSRHGRLTGALGVTMPKILMPLRSLLTQRAEVSEARALVAAKVG